MFFCYYLLKLFIFSGGIYFIRRIVTCEEISFHTLHMNAFKSVHRKVCSTFFCPILLHFYLTTFIEYTENTLPSTYYGV